MLLSRVRNKLKRTAGKLQSDWKGRKQENLMYDLTFTEASRRFPDRNGLHAYMHHYFRQICPTSIKEHRTYFKEESRGFGEDVFHAMWYLLLREFRPTQCLEIGIYRGQVVSLWALISQILEFPSHIHGISPFTPAGDNVSTYLANIDYQTDTIKNHETFSLPPPTLLKALSTDEDALALINSRKWDLIYIDGNHDYEIALSDYEVCKKNLAAGGLLVMDDASLYSDYHPPLFSFAGHPGPSRIVKELAVHELKFLGAVGHNNVFMRVKD